MRSEGTGRWSAEPEIEGRLARRFAAELTRAESDYARIPWRVDAPAPRHGVRRIAGSAFLTAALVLAMIGIAQSMPRHAGPVAPSTQTPRSTATSNVEWGADGFPKKLDGDDVYRPDIAQTVPGWLLVTGVVSIQDGPEVACGAQSTALASPNEADAILGPGSPCGRQIELVAGTSRARLARNTAGLQAGEEVVLRVHNHDGLAASCSDPAACERTLVLHEIVWRVQAPAEVQGRRVVTTKAEAASSTGQFALGGQLATPLMSCPMPATTPQPDFQLIWPCGGILIGGVPVVTGEVRLPTVAFVGPIVVVLAHTHDALAAKCAPENRPQCDAAIVVDRVLWPDSVATPSPYALGADGVPTSFDGQRVRRVGDMASEPDGTYLLGAVLRVRPQNDYCTLPSGASAACPAIWRLDQRAVARGPGAGATDLDTHRGHAVVAKVTVTTTPICSADICARNQTWTIDEIAWDGGAPKVVMGTDGLPTAIGTDTVYRTMPPDASVPSSAYLVAGALSNTTPGFLVGSERIEDWQFNPFEYLGQRVVVQIDAVPVPFVCSPTIACPPGPLRASAILVWSESRGTE